VPELPEVETVRDGLARHVVGRTVDSVAVLHPRPVRRDHRGPAGFATALTGRRFEAAHRRGKYLWLPLDNGDALLGHLGMSGQLLVQPAGHPEERHLRVRVALAPLVEERALRASRDPATQPLELRFVDQRMFGGCRPRSPTSPATRSTRSSTPTCSSRRSDAARPASSDCCSRRR